MTNEIRIRVGRYIKVIDLPQNVETAHIGDAAIAVSRALDELAKKAKAARQAPPLDRGQ